MHAGPAPHLSTAEGPTWTPVWRDEFLSRSSWGRHPNAHHSAKPQREYHIDDKGPNLKDGLHAEHHAGDD
jgi:hypothetical protein